MKIVFTAAILFFSMMASATPLNQIVIFGDSLSDNGNLYEYLNHQLPLSPPYFEGRFTNGPVWIEDLIQTYYPNNSKEHLADYAFGGAGVLEDGDDELFTLDREMDSYFQAHHKTSDEQSLYVVWIGSNNYLGVPDDVEQSIGEVILGMKHGLQRLANNGAKNILVVNVPDLGRTPVARDMDAVERLTYVVQRHNVLLDKLIVELKGQYPDVHWVYFDVNLVFDEMLNHPSEHGFTNITDTCYEEIMPTELMTSQSILKMVSSVKPKRINDPCKGYLFFDPVHPTGQAHQLMAEKTRLLLDNEGIEFQE